VKEKFVLGEKFINKNGVIPKDQLKFNDEKIVTCLYFAGSYCPPSRGFTPKLIEFYNEINTDEKLMEIIYIPFD